MHTIQLLLKGYSPLHRPSKVPAFVSLLTLVLTLLSSEALGNRWDVIGNLSLNANTHSLQHSFLKHSLQLDTVPMPVRGFTRQDTDARLR